MLEIMQFLFVCFLGLTGPPNRGWFLPRVRSGASWLAALVRR